MRVRLRAENHCGRNHLIGGEMRGKKEKINLKKPESSYMHEVFLGQSYKKFHVQDGDLTS